MRALAIIQAIGNKTIGDSKNKVIHSGESVKFSGQSVNKFLWLFHAKHNLLHTEKKKRADDKGDTIANILPECFCLSSGESNNERSEQGNGGDCKCGEVFHDEERIAENTENVNIFFVYFFFFIFAKVYFFLDKLLTKNVFSLTDFSNRIFTLGRGAGIKIFSLSSFIFFYFSRIFFLTFARFMLGDTRTKKPAFRLAVSFRYRLENFSDSSEM